MMTPTLSEKDSRLLKRLKLVGFTIATLIFFHALPGRLMLDAWPVIRWSMFSDGFLAYPAETKTTYWLDILSTNCQSDQILTDEVLKTTFPSSRPDVLKLIVDTAFMEPDHPKHDQYVQFLDDQIQREFGYEVATMTLVQRDFAYDWEAIPTHDYDAEPLETVVFGTLEVRQPDCDPNPEALP